MDRIFITGLIVWNIAVAGIFGYSLVLSDEVSKHTDIVVQDLKNIARSSYYAGCLSQCRSRKLWIPGVCEKDCYRAAEEFLKGVEF